MSTENIMIRAKEIATEQGKLANSPAQIDEQNNIILCAASCIAKAAIEINKGKEIANSFDSEVLLYEKEKFVPSIFEKYGLKRAFAKSVMIDNDALNPADRLYWFCNLK